MRLGAIADSFAERFIKVLNVAPEPLLETQLAMGMARCIMAGVKLNIFEALADARKTAEEVAKACATSVTGTTTLLNALVACRYLSHDGAAYSLTRKTRKWLLKDSPHSIRDKILFQYDEWESTEYYEEFVQTGKPLDFHQTEEDEGYWERYQRGMRALAGISASEVASRLPMPEGGRDLLDIGGSHGFYSVSLCRQHEGLKSVVLDLPQAIAHAAPLLAEEGMGDRVVHRAGNALTEDLGEEDWDLVFMSQLVHHFKDEQNRELMGRIARSLRPGGKCVILDSIRPESPSKAGYVPAILDIYFAALSESGTWPLKSIQDWMSGASLRVLKPVWLRSIPGAALVCASKGI